MNSPKLLPKLILACILLFGANYMARAQNYDASDINALQQLVISTNGNTLGGWNVLLPANQRWDISNPYNQWYGVTWSTNGTRKVLEINLEGVGLTGTLPATLFEGSQLNKLITLNLSHNGLTGSLASVWIGNNDDVSTIDISYNNFNYDNFFLQRVAGGTLKSLDNLIARNYLNTSTGATYNVPAFPPRVIHLDLGENNLVGSIPDINTAPIMEALIIDQNQLTGIIPHSAPSSSNIATIDISYNHLPAAAVANIYQNIVSYTTLRARNALDTRGTNSYAVASFITSTTANSKVKVLDFRDNKLFGTLDLNILAKVNTLLISNNQLSSLTSPTGSQGAYSTVRHLDLSYNNFQGELNAALFDKIRSLDSLFLNNNQFSGWMPTPVNGSFYQFANLYVLDLSHNRLEGSVNIDWIFSQQSNSNGPLYKFNISNNYFSSVVQYTNTNQTYNNLEFVNVENNLFEFDDLYDLAISLKMRRVTIANGTTHYLPNGAPMAGSNTDPTPFSYHPQREVPIGGLRRRPFGHVVIFNQPIGAPTAAGIYNEMYWRRFTSDTSSIEEIGKVSTLDGLNTSVISNSITSIPIGSVILSRSGTFETFSELYIPSLHGEHSNWFYQNYATNDSFPLTTIYHEPKKLVMGPCFDIHGNQIRCQEIIVEFEPGLSEAGKDSMRAALNMELVDACICGAYELWNIPDTMNEIDVENYGTGTRKAVTSTGGRPHLLNSDPNYSLDMPFATRDFNLVAPAPNMTNRPTNSTLIAIIDSGLDFEEPAFNSRIWTNNADSSQNDVDDDNNCVVDDVWGYNFLDRISMPYDDHGHGTTVAGIVAGLSNQSIIPNTGAMDSLSIVPIKYTNKDGRGSAYHTACAIRYASNYVSDNGNKIRVVNCSWGFYGESIGILKDAMRYAGLNCGILFVCSAGNRSVNNDTSRHYPSNYDLDNILTVTSLANGNNDYLAPYANFSKDHVDIAALGNHTFTGVNILNAEGSSLATAQVTRAAGILFNKYPESSYRAVKYAIMNGRDELASADSEKLTSGGRLNLTKAMTELRNNNYRSECMPKIVLSAKLQGPMANNGNMAYDLGDNNLIPTNQPYNIAPWYYTGTEIFDRNGFSGGTRFSDWVLVGFTADNVTTYKAAIILKNGDIVQADGQDFELPTLPDRKFTVTIMHRNHLPLETRNPILLEFPIASLPMSDPDAEFDVYGYKIAGSNNWRAMVAGDSNGDSQINMVDKNQYWRKEFNGTGYLPADYNLDGIVNSTDYNIILNNISIESSNIIGFKRAE